MMRTHTTAMAACPGGINMTSDDPFLRDDNGHAITQVHNEVVIAYAAALQLIKMLHQPSVEDIVPWCDTCDRQSPCATLDAVTMALTTEAR
ncbi:hypothetical protein J1771_gp72 [Gordonia phage MelBins]|uniref:Uncharacterized protein n=2 Tax=Leonardvirus TaxID=2948800 RepID=A0A649VMI5_9CAUD|nr:hypothetical protein J1771_gp72 [Gordonia phage MelBins]QGJ93626.1 hypothetical protein SEA_MELBINS_72 [Gordonia phage MelBins]UTN93149.1 hypothetical protein SEA_PHAUCI_62 [Gordonia Phage Phauci]